MDRITRHGHVDRARLLGEGSALGQLVRAQQHQQQQQQDAQQQQQQRQQQDGAASEQEEAQLNWLELWDARTTCGHVGLAMQEDQDRHHQLQLWWPQQLPSQQQQAAQKQQAQLLRYSAAMARALQRHGRQQGLAAPRGPAAAAANAQHHSVTCLLFGPPAHSRQQQQQQQHVPGSSRPAGDGAGQAGGPAADWVCCNRLLQAAAESAGAQHGPVVCGTLNAAVQQRCAECGAVRWDGPAGQLQLRLLAALRTADLNTTSVKQVAARLAAESGSKPHPGLQPPPPAVKAEVAAFLAARDAHVAATTAEASTGPQAAAGAADQPNTGAQLHVPSQRNQVDQLLPPDCPDVAGSVYTSLLTWLHDKQRQQQQQQQPRAGEAVAQVQEAAAAAAAALAPALMTGVFRQQNKLAEGGNKPVPGAIQAWIGDLLQYTAAAAAAAGTSAGQLPDPLQLHCQARPLPDWTVHTLLDRPGAVLRQELADTACAAAAAAACAGGGSSSGLPAVVCRYVLEPDGYEMMRREVPPREWLAQRCSSNSAKRRRLPAGGGDAEGDLEATQHIECSDWATVVAVRRHVHHIWATWCALTSSRGQPQQHQQQGWSYSTAVEQRLQQSLLAQRQLILQAWGSAPPFELRRGLTPHQLKRRQQQRQRHARQQCHKQQQPQHRRGRHKPSSEAGVEQSSPAAAAAAAGPSAAAGARHCRQRVQPAEAAAATARLAATDLQAEPSRQELRSRSNRKRSRALHEQGQPGGGTVAAGEPAGAMTSQQDQQQSPAKRLTRSAAAACDADAEAGAGTRPTAKQPNANSSRPNSDASKRSSSSRPNSDARSYSKSSRSDSGSESSSSDSSSSDSDSEVRSSDNGSSSSGDDEISSAATASGSGSDSDWVNSDEEARRQSRAGRNRRSASAGRDDPGAAASNAAGELEGGFDVFLASVDDLMALPTAAPHLEAFRPRPGSAWQPAAPGVGAAPMQRIPANESGAARGAARWPGLPGGMRTVLQQAAAMGLSDLVLQRTAARLRALLLPPVGG